MTTSQIKHRYTSAVLFEGESGMTTRQILEKATTAKTDLCGADLCGVNLYGADLCGADLCGVNLYGADLCGANLYGANLYGANLRNANLRSTDLCGADLCGANLYGANLCGADLCGVNLRGANLRNANLYGANLRNADLYGANLCGANLGSAFGKLIANKPYFQCGPIGSRSDYLQSFMTDKGIVIKAGCFTGFLDDFIAAVEKTHGDSDHGKEYATAVLLIEAHVAIWGSKDMTVLTHEETHALSLSSEDTLEVIRETERAVIAKMNADPRTKLRAAQAPAVMPLTAPDGRAWEASSPLHCASREQAERVPAKVAVDRIFAALLDDSNDAKDAERYRWLREAHDSADNVALWHVRGTAGQPIEAGALDAQIDEAMWQDAKVSGPSTRPPA